MNIYRYYNHAHISEPSVLLCNYYLIIHFFISIKDSDGLKKRKKEKTFTLVATSITQNVIYSRKETFAFSLLKGIKKEDKKLLRSIFIKKIK